jgi:hypothetical protein
MDQSPSLNLLSKQWFYGFCHFMPICLDSDKSWKQQISQFVKNMGCRPPGLRLEMWESGGPRGGLRMWIDWGPGKIWARQDRWLMEAGVRESPQIEMAQVWHGEAKEGTGSPVGRNSPMEKSPKFIPTCCSFWGTDQMHNWPKATNIYLQQWKLMNTNK